MKWDNQGSWAKFVRIQTNHNGQHLRLYYDEPCFTKMISVLACVKKYHQFYIKTQRNSGRHYFRNVFLAWPKYLSQHHPVVHIDWILFAKYPPPFGRQYWSQWNERSCRWKITFKILGKQFSIYSFSLQTTPWTCSLWGVISLHHVSQ